jgi:hypothetical protein
MNGEPVPDRDPAGELNASQRSAIDARQADQDRTLAAIQDLETALATAAPGRERAWTEQVVRALTGLRDATGDEDRNANEPDSLLSDIQRTQPRLRTRVRGLRAQYRHLAEAVDRTTQELQAGAGDATDFADVRQRLSWLLGALRHQRARESDLIYEAYYDAFNTDLASPHSTARSIGTTPRRGPQPKTGQDDHA